MDQIIFYNSGLSRATLYAAQQLKNLGYVFCDDVNIHTATHLLLDTPSTQQKLPNGLRNDIVAVGGNLQLPCSMIDLLKDPDYLASNAMITAHCAIKVALRETEFILPDRSMLIIGWGRIGKCLAQLLKNIGCRVTVAARKETDLALLNALGYISTTIANIEFDQYDFIFNTVPVLLVKEYNSSALVIELASTPGIVGKNVLSARGLPGKEAPASSGKLIADTIHRLFSRKE